MTQIAAGYTNHVQPRRAADVTVTHDHGVIRSAPQIAPSVRSRPRRSRQCDRNLLRITSDSNYDRVPAQVELSFDAGGVWRVPGCAMRAAAGGSAQLRSGHGLYHKGGNAVRVAVDAPAEAHTWWEISHLAGDHDGFRVLLNLQTPLDCTIRLTPGLWSPATPDAVLPW